MYVTAPAVHERGSVESGRRTQDALMKLHECSDVIRYALVRPGSEVKVLHLPGLTALKTQKVDIYLRWYITVNEMAELFTSIS